MSFNNHSKLKGQHAFLSASSPSWLNYSEDKLVDRYYTWKAAMRGTLLHAAAEMNIRLGLKQPKCKKTFCMYVNDAIGYKMTPEVVLYYSENCFGTADAISFRKNKLRIHDLKTGVGPTHMEQLKIYAALYCLEYNIAPGDIEIELRIYQNNEIRQENPEADEILPIMDKIISFDKILTKIQSEEE